MNDTKHFIVFRRTSGHCVTWLLRAPSLREALLKYVLTDDIGAELREDGSLAVYNGYGEYTLYAHPLACIEGGAKCGGEIRDWRGWEIRQLQQAHWEADFAEVFCSENPYDIQHYIELCRPLLRQRYPRSRARAFVWYLNTGPLVTFYREKRRGRRRPIEVLGRYHLPGETWPQVVEWHGTYDDILEQMTIGTVLP